MEDPNPLAIGSHEDAQQYAHRVVMGIHRRIMEQYLDTAQKELNKFSKNSGTEGEGNALHHAK